MPSRIWTIAAHEYLSNVRRKEFLLVTFGLPLLFLVLGGISALGTTVATGAFARPTAHRVGVVDRSGALDLRAASASADEGPQVVPVADEEAGKAEVRDGKLAALVVVAPDYLESGRVETYRRGGLLNEKNRAPIGPLLERAVLAKAGADPKAVRRALEPAGPDGPRQFVLEKGRFVRRDPLREVGGFVVPYLFTILLITAIFISSNYLLRGIADEKENRVIEVILSSVTAEELLRGKLIGLSGVGLTQVGLWMLLGAVPAMAMMSRIVHVSPAAVLEAVLFFALGFGLYATLMAGLGALGTTYRESQQTAGAVSMLAIFPLLLLPVLLEMPNGVFARILSFVPFTAPATMILRVTATDVPPLDIALSAALILLATWLLLKLSARLFRFGLLIYGKRPGIAETLRWLRQAG